MKYLSVCSGIEAATVAWHGLGWTPLAFSEIEEFPRAVLAHHYPDVPLHGDFTTLRHEPWIVDADLLVGGTPCQAFSIAGLRQSLADDRGNLSLEFIRLADAIDDLRRDAGREPAYICWENVPGVLSVADNAFGTFLAGLCGCDAPLVSPNEYGWSDAGVVAGPKRWAAWRVLDAQYFGLAQRRKRVFVVSRGGARGWTCADALLPIGESVRWNPAPRRQAGKVAAPTLSARTKGGGGLGTDFDCDGGLVANVVGTVSAARGVQGVALRGRDQGATAELTGDVMTALRCGGGGGDKPHVLLPIAFSAKDHGADAMLDLSPTLRAGGHAASHANAGVMPAIAFDARQSDVIQYGDKTGPLDTDGTTMGILQQVWSGHGNASEANSGALLRGVRDALGAEAFAQWGLGILDSLQPPEILRSALHGCELRPAAFSRRWVVDCALSRAETRAARAMQSLREAVGEGRASQGWQPPQQLAGQLGAYLSELSQPGAQAERLLRDLWIAAEGFGLLRQALSAVQKARRPQHGQGSAWRVRRLLVEECEFLQGFPRGYTDVPYRGKAASDGPRYKALGNSMAVNCMRWIGRRIQMVHEIA